MALYWAVRSLWLSIIVYRNSGFYIGSTKWTLLRTFTISTSSDFYHWQCICTFITRRVSTWSVCNLLSVFLILFKTNRTNLTRVFARVIVQFVNDAFIFSCQGIHEILRADQFYPLMRESQTLFSIPGYWSVLCILGFLMLLLI